ncbi:hypothetical protein VTO73DRAFT_873 [Trametes versicolor]
MVWIVRARVLFAVRYIMPVLLIIRPSLDVDRQLTPHRNLNVLNKEVRSRRHMSCLMGAIGTLPAAHPSFAA